MLDDVYDEISLKMDYTIEHLTKEFAGVRTGRASTGLLDSISVDYYGVLTPIKQIASLSVPDPLTIAIQPWETTMLDPVAKAIMTSDLGLNPNSDGKIIRINIPTLTEERRKDLTKHVRKISEVAKIALRNVRREGIERVKKLEKDKEISEDDARGASAKIQQIIDEHIAKVEKVTDAKEHEIMDR